MMPLIREALVPGILVVFGIIYYFSVHDLPKHSTVFPYFLMIVMPVLIVLIFVQENREMSARGENTSAPKTFTADFKAPAVVFAGSIGYLLLFFFAGFLAAATIYVFSITVYFGTKPVKSAIISVAFTVALYVVFGKIFLVDL
jgi:hypothetical protein